MTSNNQAIYRVCFALYWSRLERKTFSWDLTVAHIRWPISATAKLTFPRQNFLFHGKTLFLTAKLSFPRQNFISHGKTFFSTAKLTFPRQNFISHGKTFFFTAKLYFSRQNFLFHGKTYFSTAQLSFPRHNFLFHGRTFFFTANVGSSLVLSVLSRQFRSRNFVLRVQQNGGRRGRVCVSISFDLISFSFYSLNQLPSLSRLYLFHGDCFTPRLY